MPKQDDGGPEQNLLSHERPGNGQLAAAARSSAAFVSALAGSSSGTYLLGSSRRGSLACGGDPGSVPFALSHYAFVSAAAYEKKGVLVARPVCFAGLVITRDIFVAPIYDMCSEIEP